MIATKYLIIGNSAAAIGAIEGIRKQDPDGKILLVSDESHHTYSRPLISYWLEGRVEPEHMLYRDPAFYETNDVETRLGEDGKVVSLNPQTHTAELSNGQQISYESCLLATGSTPFVPPIEGLKGARHTFTFTKWDDAQCIHDLLEELDKPAKVVILGAGLIGLKAAEALYAQVESIDVVDLAERILPSVLTKATAPIMQDYLEEKGIRFHLGQSIQEILSDQTVKLSGGEKLPYDILILAAGTRPQTVLASAAGLACQRGILTDSRQLSSVEDIYAAGDCTDSFDITSGAVRNIAILPNAYLQGRCAGTQMAGGEETFEQAFALNALGLLGFYMLSAGSYNGDEHIVMDESCEKHFFINDNVLNGFIIFGDCNRAGIYTDLIRSQTDLSEIDTQALFESPGLMAFSKDARSEMLAQAH